MTTSELNTTDWSRQPARSALGAAELAEALRGTGGWQADGDAITRTYRFANYYETIAFVNALALVAHRLDHHPDLSVHYDRCVVRLNTHDARGVSATDIDMAQRIDALLAP